MDVAALIKLPTVSIADAGAVIEDGPDARNLRFVVTLNAASERVVKVDYATATGGSATTGADYTAVSGTLTFNVGQISKIIIVPVLPDTLDEANEIVRVNLRDAVSAVIADNQGQGTITDNDDASVTSG